MNPKTYSSQDHQIRPEKIDKDALYALKKLHRAGFTTYLVGGSVRDLLLGHVPKDVDISTSARPEEVRRLFSNCFLIGRRFRLAHLHFGRKIFQVSTFRAGDTEQESLITQDNTWGTPEEDVLRRDFTINGLFYDPTVNSVIDYVNGWEDIQDKVLRTIGKPVARFKQDPVRMIRALKFQARLGFAIDQETDEALQSCREEIAKSAPARLLEEMLKMIDSGASQAFFALLIERDFFPLLLPSLQKLLHGSLVKRFFETLKIADRLLVKEKELHWDRNVLFANFLFPFVEKRARLDHLRTVLGGLIRHSAITVPKRMVSHVEQIYKDYWQMLKSSKPHNASGYEGHCMLQFIKLRAVESTEAASLLKTLHTHQHHHHG